MFIPLKTGKWINSKHVLRVTATKQGLFVTAYDDDATEFSGWADEKSIGTLPARLFRTWDMIEIMEGDFLDISRASRIQFPPPRSDAEKMKVRVYIGKKDVFHTPDAKVARLIRERMDATMKNASARIDVMGISGS